MGRSPVFLASMALIAVTSCFGRSRTDEGTPAGGSSWAGATGITGSGGASAGGATMRGAGAGGAITGGGAGTAGTGGAGPATGGTGGFFGCYGIIFSAEQLPVDMYIMLDKSTSMVDLLGSETKWDVTVSAIQSFVQNPRAAGIGVGLQYFGLPDVCNPDAYAVPAVPIAQLPTGADDIIASTSAEVPSTLTPTAPALHGALEYMQAHAAANPGRASVVVLVTDGFPTECGVECTGNADCLSGWCLNGMCDPNSIAEIEALAERYATMDPPILTFVVGVGEGLENLSIIARGGGTGEAFFIASADEEAQLIDALLNVSSTPLSCEFDLPVPTDPSEQIDPTKAQVIYTPASTGIPVEIPKVNHAGECALNNDEGWYYDDALAPTKILVCPGTCESFGAGTLSIELGCVNPIPPL